MGQLPFELREQARPPIKGVDELLRAHAEAFMLDEEDLPLVRSELKSILKDERSIITTIHDGRLQGYCVVTPLEEYRDEEPVNAFSFYPFGSTAYVRYIGCLPEFRGRGLSKVLLERAFAQARERGYRFGAGHFRDGASHRAALHAFGDGVEVSESLRYGRNNDLFHYMIGRI